MLHPAKLQCPVCGEQRIEYCDRSSVHPCIFTFRDQPAVMSHKGVSLDMRENPTEYCRQQASSEWMRSLKGGQSSAHLIHRLCHQRTEHNCLDHEWRNNLGESILNRALENSVRMNCVEATYEWSGHADNGSMSSLQKRAKMYILAGQYKYRDLALVPHICSRSQGVGSSS